MRSRIGRFLGISGRKTNNAGRPGPLLRRMTAEPLEDRPKRSSVEEAVDLLLAAESV